MFGRPTMSARLIVVEGSDGSGKSTHCRLLTSELTDHGYDVVHVKFPRYATFVGTRIARWLRDGRALSNPLRFQFMQWFDKWSFQVFELKRLLRDNDYVILDRWRASVWVYGLTGGVATWILFRMLYSLRGSDVTFVLTGSNKRSVPDDCYENDVAFQKYVGSNYDVWSKMMRGVERSEEVVAVDTDRRLETVAAEILTYVLYGERVDEKEV